MSDKRTISIPYSLNGRTIGETIAFAIENQIPNDPYVSWCEGITASGEDCVWMGNASPKLMKVHCDVYGIRDMFGQWEELSQ